LLRQFKKIPARSPVYRLITWQCSFAVRWGWGWGALLTRPVRKLEEHTLSAVLCVWTRFIWLRLDNILPRALAETTIKLRVLQKAGNFLTSWAITISTTKFRVPTYNVQGKGKVVPVPFFNTAQCNEGVLGEWKYSSTHYTSALDGGEWSVSRPAALPPREIAPCTHSIRDWVDLKVGLDAVVRRKIPSPYRESIIQPVA
jgi:hypothetical protein